MGRQVGGQIMSNWIRSFDSRDAQWQAAILACLAEAERPWEGERQVTGLLGQCKSTPTERGWKSGIRGHRLQQGASGMSGERRCWTSTPRLLEERTSSSRQLGGPRSAPTACAAAHGVDVASGLPLVSPPFGSVFMVSAVHLRRACS